MMDPARSLIIWLSMMMKITNLWCIRHQSENPTKESRYTAIDDGDLVTTHDVTQCDFHGPSRAFSETRAKLSHPCTKCSTEKKDD